MLLKQKLCNALYNYTILKFNSSFYLLSNLYIEMVLNAMKTYAFLFIAQSKITFIKIYIICNLSIMYNGLIYEYILSINILQLLCFVDYI